MHSFKKVSTLALSLCLTASLSLPVFAAMFTDTTGHWAQPAIEDLAQQRILTGYPTGEFRPEGQITRAEFATMLVKALNLDSQFVDNGSNFVDVSRSFWGYRPIEIVSDKGLVSGYPGGYFRPNQSITRAESMAILTTAAHVPLPTQSEAANILRNYSDAYMVPQWAQRAVAGAIQSGIYANFPSPNMIQPMQPATRGEVAVMADNMDTYLANRGGSTSPVATGNNQPTTTQPTYTPDQTSSSTTYNQQNDTIRGRVSVVPAQTVFTGVVTQNISSDRSQVGDPVSLTLDRPILSAAGDIVVPQGSQLVGSIIRIDPAGRAEKNAGMVMDFNRVITPSGQTFAISAEVNAEDGVLKGGTTAGRAGRIAGRSVGGAAVGGAAGAILGAIKGDGKADDYLARGAILGGGLGAASSIISKGNEVLLQPGDTLQVRLRQPLTVTTETP